MQLRFYFERCIECRKQTCLCIKLFKIYRKMFQKRSSILVQMRLNYFILRYVRSIITNNIRIFHVTLPKITTLLSYLPKADRGTVLHFAKGRKNLLLALATMAVTQTTVEKYSISEVERCSPCNEKNGGLDLSPGQKKKNRKIKEKKRQKAIKSAKILS